MSVLIAAKSKKGVFSYSSSIGSIVSMSLFLLKTIFLIPLSIIVIIALSPSTATELNITLNQFDKIFGITLTCFLLLVLGYLTVFFQEKNPFGNLPHAG